MQSFTVIFSVVLLAFSVDATVYFKEQFLDAGKFIINEHSMLANKELR